LAGNPIDDVINLIIINSFLDSATHLMNALRIETAREVYDHTVNLPTISWRANCNRHLERIACSKEKIINASLFSMLTC